MLLSMEFWKIIFELELVNKQMDTFLSRYENQQYSVALKRDLR